MLKTLKKLLTILPRGDKRKMGLLFLLMLLGGILEVAGVGMIPVFVATVQDPDRLFSIQFLQPLWDYLSITTSQELLIYGSVFLIGIFLVKNIYNVFLNYIQSRFVFNRYGIIASRLFETYMNVPYTFHLGRNTSELIRNVTNEARLLSNNVMLPMLSIAMEAVMVLGIFTLLLAVEPAATLFTLLLLGGGGGLFLKVIKKRMQRHGRHALQERSRIIQAVNEGLGGFKDATIMNRQNWFVLRFKEYMNSLVSAETFKQVASQGGKPVIETLAVAGMVFIALILLWQGRAMDSIIPVLSLFGAATVRLMPALQKMINEFNQMRYNAYALDPIYEDLASAKKYETQEIRKATGPKRLPLEERITLQNISYRYPGSEEFVLNDLSLSIPKGSVVGFVGPSGAGKTTVVDIILGLLEPQKGSLNVDGVDVQSSRKAWQKNIGYIPQFIYLADASIRQNIAFGLPEEEINEQWLREAVKAAQLEEMIGRLPEGLDTIIGEHGTRLSGGQRQRVGIARALYHNPQVLIMDEATSALDNYTEKFVIDAIEQLRGDRTILMIAHRMTTVQNCDVIYMLKDGELVEQGTYRELMESSHAFREMSQV